MLILSVYDTAAQSYESVFSKSNEAEAIREFTLACRNPQLMYNQFPEQFELHQLATIDSKGELVDNNKKTIMLALTVQALDKLNAKNEEQKNAN